ncbi:MAG: HAD-IIIA family hydrolase [Acidimicrobiales bacterium]
MTSAYDIVVPTLGRPCLASLLDRLAAETVEADVILVDDRRCASTPLLPFGAPPGLRVDVIRGSARGPAAARNLGWRAGSREWVAFLDDDVVPEPGWAAAMAGDLAACGPGVAATQGRLRVPMPADRRPTDWERNVAGLEQARWATADMAYRRRTLVAVGGFDERFPRAYREDADLGLRVLDAGGRIVTGQRLVSHPVRPAPWHISVGKQAGNADDALMDRLHGHRWRHRAGAPPGRRRRHLAVTAAGAIALAGALTHRRPLAGAGAAVWAAGTAELAWRRIAPGPRTTSEMVAMVTTSLALPLAATAYWVAGLPRARRLAATVAVDAVLLDRDGTLVIDVPYNGDPAQVLSVPGAGSALDRLRSAGVRLAIVSNQSGIARGLVTQGQVDAVNERVEQMLGPFDAVLTCPHAGDDGCACRKPEPGLLHKAMAELGTEPARCALIGDIGADVEAALSAGIRPILVPTDVTRPEEVASAPTVAPDLAAAVDLVLGVRR